MQVKQDLEDNKLKITIFLTKGVFTLYKQLKYELKDSIK